MPQLTTPLIALLTAAAIVVTVDLVATWLRRLARRQPVSKPSQPETRDPSGSAES